MPIFPTKSNPRASNGDDARDYLFDMIAQLAQLARNTGEAQVAILLEAILVARETALEERSM